MELWVSEAQGGRRQRSAGWPKEQSWKEIGWWGVFQRRQRRQPLTLPRLRNVEIKPGMAWIRMGRHLTTSGECQDLAVKILVPINIIT